MKRRKTKKRKIAVSKPKRRRKTPVMFKSNPMPARKRRRRQHVMSKRKIRRIRRNPGSIKNFDFVDVLTHGVIAGAGSFGALWISNKVNDLASSYTKNSPVARNAIALAVALAGSYAGYKFLEKDKAEALAHGMVGAILLVLAKNAFGFNLGLAGDVSYLPSGYENIGLLEQPTLGLLENKLAGSGSMFDYASMDDFDDYR